MLERKNTEPEEDPIMGGSTNPPEGAPLAELYEDADAAALIEDHSQPGYLMVL